MLEGPCICYHFLLGYLPDVSTCKNGIRWGINFCLWRHGGTGGPWRVDSPGSNSCNHHGSPKDVLTSLDSFLVSSFSGTADSSLHQSRVSHLSASQETHRLESEIASSGGVFLPSLSKVSSDPHRKEATIGFSSGHSSKSEPLPSDPSSPCGVLGLADVLGSVDWLGAGSSANLTWRHLLFCPSPLGLWWSLLLDLSWDFEQAWVQLSLLISSSKVATAAKAFWWVLHMVAKFLSIELSLLSQWGALFLDEWEPLVGG